VSGSGEDIKILCRVIGGHVVNPEEKQAKLEEECRELMKEGYEPISLGLSYGDYGGYRDVVVACVLLRRLRRAG
jgi:hypothetical protein